MENRAEEELIATYLADSSAAEGRAALDELFRRYQARVALWCFRIAGDREWAADLAQEVFLKAYRNLESYRGNSKFSTWLYAIARNHCFNEMQSRATRPDTRDGDEALLNIAGTEDPAAELERDSSRRYLQQLLADNLTELEAKVMTLHYGEELPLDAVGRMLRLDNASGAKAYIVSAKRKLSRVIERWRARPADGRR